MSQSWFSLGFLSQNSFQKLSTFREYKGIYNRVREECEKTLFLQNKTFWRLILAIGTSRKFELRVNCQAKLYFLSCNALAVVTLQFPTCFTRMAFWRVASPQSLTRSSHEKPPNACTLEFLHTLSHTTPTLFPPKYRYLIAKIQANLTGNKANTLLNKFNLTIFFKYKSSVQLAQSIYSGHW